MLLLDSNILVYALNASAPQHKECRRLVEAALAGRIHAVLVPQVLVEAYAILTDRRRVEKPLDGRTAWQELEICRLAIPLLDWGERTMELLGLLVEEHKIAGQYIFDALLVAQMQAHGVRTICTYNTRDFDRFPGIRAIPPARVGDLR